MLLAIYGLVVTTWLALTLARAGEAESGSAADRMAVVRLEAELVKARRRAAERRDMPVLPPEVVAAHDGEKIPAAVDSAPGGPDRPAPRTHPAPDSDVRPRVRVAFEAYVAAQADEDHVAEDRLKNELSILMKSSADAHAELMQMLRETTDPDRIYEIECFLLWDPFTKTHREWDATLEICESARALARGSSDIAQRVAAIKVLLMYPDSDLAAENASEVIEVWRREANLAARDAIFEEISGWGLHPMPEADSQAVAAELRRRATAGDARAANLLAGWSREPADFDLLLTRFKTASVDDREHMLGNAFQINRPLMRGREAEARAALVSVLSDPSQSRSLRGAACRTLRNWLPWDAETEDWVRRFEGEDRASQEAEMAK